MLLRRKSLRVFLTFASSLLLSLTASLLQANVPVGAAQLPPIKIGFLYPQTGNFAANGQDMNNGFSLWLVQHHDTIAGRKVEVFRADTKGDPQMAITQAEKLVEQDHVDVLFGPLTAPEGAAIVPFIDTHHVPTVFPIVSDDNLTQRARSPWIARTGWTSSQTTQPLGWYAARVLHDKRVAVIAEDLSFAWQSVGGFVQTFQQNGGRVVKEIWTPLTTTNFSPYFSEIPKNIDAVFAVYSGAIDVNFIHQYRQFGLKYPLIGQGNLTDESTLPAVGTAAIGIVTALHYSAALQNKYNMAFRAAYEKAYGRMPSYFAEGTYTGMMVLAKGIEAVHGNIADKKALIRAMCTASIPDAPRGPIRMDAYCNPIENVYIRKTELVHGQLENVVIYTFPHVSQFWTTPPRVFLAHPEYSRTYPPITGP